ncbi:hypothetical protein [Rhizobium sp. BK376]|uniref:hypothetical protein n=1 Tax=Rhizobium sp. BK376 TaxID=2512149 RepID=UPI001052146C|nr:hypothetical protein [Rhizobium sp. BK376]TCR83894.1 hypothetical protein EV561_108118 [Rhizobium sp. BK376]
MKVDTNTNRYSIYAGQKQQPAGNADFASQIADISGAEDDASSGDTYDFTDMTPSQVQTAAENLFQSGDIDLTQAFKLQTIGLPLGTMGPDGTVVPLSSAQRADYSNTPMNYIQLTQGAVDSIVQQGQAGDPRSGYQNWQSLLSTLQNMQAEPESSSAAI